VRSGPARPGPGVAPTLECDPASALSAAGRLVRTADGDRSAALSNANKSFADRRVTGDPPRSSPRRRAASTQIRESTNNHKPYFIKHRTGFCLWSERLPIAWSERLPIPVLVAVAVAVRVVVMVMVMVVVVVVVVVVAAAVVAAAAAAAAGLLCWRRGRPAAVGPPPLRLRRRRLRRLRRLRRRRQRRRRG
jgi:hypothetical protein